MALELLRPLRQKTAVDGGTPALPGIMVLSFLLVMQDLYHQPYPA